MFFVKSRYELAQNRACFFYKPKTMITTKKIVIVSFSFLHPQIVTPIFSRLIIAFYLKFYAFLSITSSFVFILLFLLEKCFDNAPRAIF